MKHKLLVVNIQNPNETKYIPIKTAGSYMWGRRLSNYMLIIMPQQVIIDLYDVAGVVDLQSKVTTAVEGLNC